MLATAAKVMARAMMDREKARKAVAAVALATAPVEIRAGGLAVTARARLTQDKFSTRWKTPKSFAISRRTVSPAAKILFTSRARRILRRDQAPETACPRNRDRTPFLAQVQRQARGTLSAMAEEKVYHSRLTPLASGLTRVMRTSRTVGRARAEDLKLEIRFPALASLATPVRTSGLAVLLAAPQVQEGTAE